MSQVSLYANWGHLLLKMQHSTTKQAKQKISANLGAKNDRKFPPILKQIMLIYLCANELGLSIRNSEIL